MKIPKYWARGSHPGDDADGPFTAYGWSFESPEEAARVAQGRAEQIYRRFLEGTLVEVEDSIDRYDYLDVPLREEIVDSIEHDGKELAVITRNRYGALVLNTPDVMFVDIDLSSSSHGEANEGWLDRIVALFSARKRRERMEAAEKTVLHRILRWSEAHPEHAFRIYRTRGGFRLLFTSARFDPTSEEVRRIFEELGADPLYRKLTEKQESFRARLSPKYWRCGVRKPPPRYPWNEAEEERHYRDWEKEYGDAARMFRTCIYVQKIGRASEDAGALAILQLHERYTCRDAALPLA
jgi:hypothetical protein